MIGIIVPDITNPYFMEISKGIEDTVGQSGFQLMFCSSDENTDKESRLLQLLNEKRVDAVVIATAGGNGARIASMSRSGLPVVLIDRAGLIIKLCDSCTYAQPCFLAHLQAVIEDTGYGCS